MVDLLLYCHAETDDLLKGRWQFSLQSEEGEAIMDASDDELGDLNRLALWSAVRGLEAIDGARRVTLLSSNRYLIRSMTDSLPRWRTNDFVWEHFGHYTDVQNADLWRRVDRALAIHRVGACLMQTQMVSPPIVENASDPILIDAPLIRADDAHVSVPAPRRRRRLTKERSNIQPSATNIGESPLRKMLADKVTPPSRRFTAAQLAAS